MSLTLSVWLLVFIGLLIAAFQRPVFAVSLYMLTFFLSPRFWWWGDAVQGYRWNFYSGLILLVVSFLVAAPELTGRARTLFHISLAIIANATIVNFAIAGNSDVSFESYELLVKFFVLAYLIYRTVRTDVDLQIVMMSILLGAAYIGFECTFNGRGDIVSNRLEGVGAPGATTANHFASLMVTLLPLLAPFFLAGRLWSKVLVVCLAPLIVNVVLLCNSRSAFLGAILSAVVFIVMSPRKIRFKAIKVVVAGAFGVFLLMGDARIVERFVTTFAAEEDRDASAQSRLDFAVAGLSMVADYPLGSGGNGFKKVHGIKYLSKDGLSNVARAVHNGYVNEACEWGIQGLALRLLWFFTGSILAWCFIRNHQESDDAYLFLVLTQIALLSGLAAFLVTYMFGDQNSSEWGNWILALMLAIATLQVAEESELDPEETFEMEGDDAITS